MTLGEGGQGLSLGALLWSCTHPQHTYCVVGQRQLVCLARVLLRRPQVLLLDECTAHMDPSNAAWMQHVLERFHQVAGCSMVQIAHQLRHIMEYDNVLVMDGGSVVEHGSPDDLLARAGVFASMASALDKKGTIT